MAQESTSINLLDQPEFESSSMGKLLSWAITYGRYIMIGTEIIVLLAFISRFSLDRRLTDLREEISQKQIILQANLPFEQDFNQLQLTLQKMRKLLNNQTTPINYLYTVTSYLPSDVSIIEFDDLGTSLELNVLAGTTDGFSTFMSQMQNSPLFSDIEVTQIQKDAIRGVQFHLTAKIK